ncbi:hypothetical protein [Nautilia sp.]
MNIEEFDNNFFKMLKIKFKNAKMKIIIKEDETEYLLKNEANREFLLKSLDDLKSANVILL